MDLPDQMKAMVLKAGSNLLQLEQVPVPQPAEGQVLVKVLACGVCRTDLHIIDRELPNPKLPLIPGHEIIGTIVKNESCAMALKPGDLVGIPWLGHTCGQCKYCKSGLENLCDSPLFTGYTMDGGFAEYTLAYEKYCIPLRSIYANPSAAPLMCAGLIGFRCYNMLPESAKNIGFYGFGAAAHILIQIARYEGKKVFAFTRSNDFATQNFALQMGADWAGDSSAAPPVELDAAIIFAPAGNLVPQALQNIAKGGMVICGGIHMSNIPSFPYYFLWGERSIKSVANLSRKDAELFFQLAQKVPIHTEVSCYKLEQANEALGAMRSGRIQGAAVLVMEESLL